MRKTEDALKSWRLSEGLWWKKLWMVGRANDLVMRARSASDIHQHTCVSSESDIDTNDASMELGGVLAALICVCAAFDVATSRLSLDR